MTCSCDEEQEGSCHRAGRHLPAGAPTGSAVRYSPATARVATTGASATIERSGRIQRVITIAHSNSTMENANGIVQLPVRSRMKAKATGDRMPATAPEVFISALEEP